MMPKLPHRVSLHRVVPCLAKEFVNPTMVPFVLPAVLHVAEEASKADFVAHILPEIKPVMKMTEPVQVRRKGKIQWIPESSFSIPKFVVRGITPRPLVLV